MFSHSPDSDFRRYRASGDPAALGRVFDAVAPELLKLARHLAATSLAGEREACAEDLVQATFVTAIESAQQHDGDRRVLPWLVGVLTNHARAARRKARRGTDAQAAARGARSELGMRDPAQDAEQRELQDSLVEAIASLPEAYRPVMTLYLEHGLEPVEIGRALDRPATTVRTQVSRGLSRVREILSKDYAAAGLAAVAGLAAAGRGLASVRTAVLQRCSAIPEVAAATSAGAASSAVGTTARVGGVLAMMSSKLWILTMVGVAALASLFLLWPADAPTEDPLGGLARVESEGVRVDGPLPVSPAEAVGETRRDVDASDELETTASQVLVTPPPPERVLRLRLVRAADRSPLVGVPVVLLRGMDPTARSPRSAVTSEVGQVEFVDPPMGQLAVSVPYIGVLRAVDVDEATPLEHEITVPVRLGVRVRGRVVGAAGQPLAGVTVLAHGIRLVPDVVARTDDDGRFEIVDMGAGAALSALDTVRGPSLAYAVRGTPGDVVELELRLDGDARRVAGRVLQPDGAPAAGASVLVYNASKMFNPSEASHERPAVAKADAQGDFEILVRQDMAGPLTAVAIPRAEGHAASCQVVPAGAGGGAGLDLVVRSGARVSGRVRSSRGELAGLQVWAFTNRPDEDFGQVLNLMGNRRVPVGEDGSFVLQGLLPGTSRFSVVRPSGAVLADVSWALRDGESRTWDVDLDAGPAIRGRVQLPESGAGKAVGTWSASLFRAAAAGERGGAAGLEFVKTQVLGGDGVVEFVGLDAAVDYTVHITRFEKTTTAGRSQMTVGRFGPYRAGAHDLVLAVSDAELPSGVIRGRLVGESGVPRGGEELRAVFQSDDPGRSGVAFAQTQTAADGSFELGPLSAGRWVLMTGQARSMRVVAQISSPPLAKGEVRDLESVVVK